MRISLAFFFAILAISAAQTETDETTTVPNQYPSQQIYPVIGVLSIPNTALGTLKSEIPLDAVEFIESNGGVPVPFFWNLPSTDLINYLDVLNGLYIPGDAADILLEEDGETTTFSSFLVQIRFIYNTIVDMNRQGNVFPIWGSSMAMEAVFLALTEDPDIRQTCTETNQTGTVVLTEQGYVDAALAKVPDYLKTFMETDPLFGYFPVHTCFNNDTFTNNIGISENYNILGLSVSELDTEFVSFVAGKIRPFYFNNFHLEETVWRYKHDENTQGYKRENVMIGLGLMRAYLDKAKFSTNSFPTVNSRNLVAFKNFAVNSILDREGYYYILDENEMLSLHSSLRTDFATVSSQMGSDVIVAPGPSDAGYGGITILFGVGFMCGLIWLNMKLFAVKNETFRKSSIHNLINKESSKDNNEYDYGQYIELEDLQRMKKREARNEDKITKYI